MQPWSQFYAVIGAAAAALMGLLFVTLSVNAKTTPGSAHESSQRLAEQAFQNYLTVLMVSLLALFPGMTVSTFGFVAVCVTAIWAVWVLVRFYWAAVRTRGDEGRLSVLRRHLSTLIGFAMLIVAASRMAMGVGDARNWFASANIVLLFSATTVSWEMLVKIAQDGRNHQE